MKLIDAFMGFLILVGGLQFVYCVLVGNYVSFFSFLSCFRDLGFPPRRASEGRVGYELDWEWTRGGGGNTQ